MEQIKNDILAIKNPITAFLFIGSFIVGLFNEPAGALCSIVLTVLLALCFRKKKVELAWGVSTFAIALISVSYLVVSLWAKDTYYALLGFVKFFPLLLFYLYISVQKNFDGQKVLIFVPYAATLMTVISYIFSKFEATEDLFSVDGRIAGFFQYPNTFALFLIIGIIVIAFQKQMHPLYYVMDAIMIFGIFMSGSRTSFVLFAVVVIALLFVSKNKKLKLLMILISVALIAAAVVIFLISSKRGALGRFLSISLTSGTFNARLLYIKDAARQILKHPFGTGYMSYYFTQGSFQTGFYANRYVHNELLQLMLDVGWLPGIAAIVCAVKAFISKQKPLMLKIILAVILVHAMLDFDLQFLSICFIALICIQENNRSTVFKCKPAAKAILLTLLSGICCLSIYLGASSSCFLLKKYDAAAAICKSNTMAQIERINASRDIQERKEIAQIILKNNSYIPNAYFALAQSYYTKGNISNFAKYARKSIACNQYNNEAHTAYVTQLMKAVEYYEKHNDQQKLEECIKLLQAAKKRVALLNAQVDPLAKYLPEHQALDLGEQTNQDIDRLSRHYLNSSA